VPVFACTTEIRANSSAKSGCCWKAAGDRRREAVAETRERAVKDVGASFATLLSHLTTVVRLHGHDPEFDIGTSATPVRTAAFEALTARLDLSEAAAFEAAVEAAAVSFVAAPGRTLLGLAHGVEFAWQPVIVAQDRCPASATSRGGWVRLPDGSAGGQHVNQSSTGAPTACRGSNSPLAHALLSY
jgi:hypothetical protein